RRFVEPNPGKRLEIRRVIFCGVRRPLLAVAVAVAVALSSTLAIRAASAQPNDWGPVVRDKFDKGVVAKYKGILAKSPHDGDALNRLVAMYKKYRSIDLLHDEYTAALTKTPDDFDLLVVTARIDKIMGDEPAALGRFESAAKQKPDDAQVQVEIGTLYRNSGKKDEAKVAFDAALKHADDKTIQMTALRALAALALSANDADAAKKYFDQYIDLEPKNTQLRLELGDA